MHAGCGCWALGVGYHERTYFFRKPFLLPGVLTISGHDSMGVGHCLYGLDRISGGLRGMVSHMRSPIRIKLSQVHLYKPVIVDRCLGPFFVGSYSIQRRGSIARCLVPQLVVPNSQRYVAGDYPFVDPRMLSGFSLTQQPAARAAGRTSVFPVGASAVIETVQIGDVTGAYIEGAWCGGNSDPETSMYWCADSSTRMLHCSATGGCLR